MKFQDSSFNGLKVTVGIKSVTHPPKHPPTHAPKALCPINFFKVGGINKSAFPYIVLFGNCMDPPLSAVVNNLGKNPQDTHTGENNWEPTTLEVMIKMIDSVRRDQRHVRLDFVLNYSGH